MLKLILLIFLFSCAKAVELKGVKATQTSVQSTVATVSSGTVEAKQDAILAFGIPGRIRKILCKVGETVKAGDILATLENNDLKVTMFEAEKEYNRSQKLYKSSLISLAQFDQALRSYEVAKSNYEKSTIVAPFNGIIIEMNLEVGELSQTTTLDPTKPLIRIIDLEKRIIRGNIDEIDVKNIKLGQIAEIKIPALKENNIQAKIIQISPYVSATKDQDRTVEIKLEFLDSKMQIPVGASADVEITTDFKDKVLAIPTRTIQKKVQQKYVFVLNGSALERREVETGIGNYERTEITKGLNENDIVVYPNDKVELKEDLKAKVDLAQWP
ncbi:MAG: efflux RND transporter periplasmic adaptor subunit [Bacteriovoracaceae bacterium]